MAHLTDERIRELGREFGEESGFIDNDQKLLISESFIAGATFYRDLSIVKEKIAHS